MAAVVAKTPAATGKAFEFDIDSDFSMSIDRADLEELLGNLIENATRHPVSTVRIRSARIAMFCDLRYATTAKDSSWIR